MKTTLAITNPNLAEEWDYSKNGDLSPETVSPTSGLRVHWKCKHGHEWQAAIYSRHKGGNGCPICSGKQVLKGFNDLVTRCPDIVKMWDKRKNGKLTPYMVTVGSQEIVHWKCKLGHCWTAPVVVLTKGRGCPECAKLKLRTRKKIKTETLMETNPKLAAEWDYKKNEILTPTAISPGSHKEVYWLCEHGHSWKAKIKNRHLGGTGCPFCVGKRIMSGLNDLATKNPRLSEEWHPTLNGTLTPETVMPNSGQKAYWKCRKCEHIWCAIISSRNRGNGCPGCFRKRSTKTS